MRWGGSRGCESNERIHADIPPCVETEPDSQPPARSHSHTTPTLTHFRVRHLTPQSTTNLSIGAGLCAACYHSGVSVLEPGDRDPAESGRACYEFVLRGRLDPSWSDWFDGLQLRTTDDGHTLLIGVLPDQSALHGVLARIRDLGIELLGLRRLDDC